MKRDAFDRVQRASRGRQAIGMTGDDGREGGGEGRARAGTR